MDGIIVYGSLLSVDELEDVFGSTADFTPVKVFGWRRCFNQKADVRSPEDGAQGVMNVVSDASSWFNGVLVSNLSESSITRYRERETGYELKSVEGDQIQPYNSDGYTVDVDKDYRVASGRRFMENPEPIPSYATVCVEGAAEWGDKFLADFLVQTYRT